MMDPGSVALWVDCWDWGSDACLACLGDSWAGRYR